MDYVYLRDNPRGPLREYWHHAGGCRRWLVVTRGGYRVLCNLGADEVLVPLDSAASAVVMAWEGTFLSSEGVRLPGRSAAVVKVVG